VGCSQLLEELEEPKDEAEVRMSILDEDFKQTASDVIDAFTTWLADVPEWEIKEPNYEGVRVMVKGEDGDQTGWLLLRASLHDPLLVVNAESEVEGGVPPRSLRLQTVYPRHNDGPGRTNVK
jgi:phosphomannomutase